MQFWAEYRFLILDMRFTFHWSSCTDLISFIWSANPCSVSRTVISSPKLKIFAKLFKIYTIFWVISVFFETGPRVWPPLYYQICTWTGLTKWRVIYSRPVVYSCDILGDSWNYMTGRACIVSQWWQILERKQILRFLALCLEFWWNKILTGNCLGFSRAFVR